MRAGNSGRTGIAARIQGSNGAYSAALDRDGLDDGRPVGAGDREVGAPAPGAGVRDCLRAG